MRVKVLQPEWKRLAKEIENIINKATRRHEELLKSNVDSHNAAIIAPLHSLSDQFGRYQKQQERTDRERKHRECATIAGLFLTALFTLITAIIFYGQLREMRKVYGPIKDQAAATRDAIAVSQRPIVYFVPSAFAHYTTAGGTWATLLGIGNSGNLPTKDLSYKVGCIPSPAKIADPFASQKFTEQRMIQMSIGPKVVITPNACEYGTGDMSMISKGILYVFGLAEYKDRFDDSKKRTTEYCFEINPIYFDPQGNQISGNANPCVAGHNCADEECGEDKRPNP
jgi:hypothetical protein